MPVEDGWELLERFLDKKINYELKFAELFMLSISAEIIILSLSTYKNIIFSVVIQAICLIWILITMMLDLQKKKTEKTGKMLHKISFMILPFGLNEFLIITLYVLSILIMAIIVLIPSIITQTS